MRRKREREKKNWISLLGAASLAEGKAKPRMVEDVPWSHENHSIRNIKNETVHRVKNRKKEKKKKLQVSADSVFPAG